MTQSRLSLSLKRFSTCDMSDGLLKLGVSGGGFLPDILPRTLPKQHHSYPIVGRAWTVRFVHKADPVRPDFAGHYIDQVPASIAGGSADGSEELPVIPVLGAPPELTCAVLGGIMALQASLRKATAIVVSGRIRDVEEMNSPSSTAAVFSHGLSTVGAGAGSKVASIGTTCEVAGHGSVTTGDIVCIDKNGIVVIPAKINVYELISLMNKSTEQDEKVKKSVKEGMSVEDAFKKWRS